jgi:hypothetical protein
MTREPAVETAVTHGFSQNSLGLRYPRCSGPQGHGKECASVQTISLSEATELVAAFERGVTGPSRHSSTEDFLGRPGRPCSSAATPQCNHPRANSWGTRMVKPSGQPPGTRQAQRSHHPDWAFGPTMTQRNQRSVLVDRQALTRSADPVCRSRGDVCLTED